MESKSPNHIIEEVGNYRLIIGEDVSLVVPLSPRVRLKNPTFISPNGFADGRIPKYVREYDARRRRHSGVVYLIHFDEKIADHAQHYIGFTKNLDKRLLMHNAGRGSALMAEVNRLGIGYTVVRTWYGDRYFERKLKRGHNHKRHCPICKEAA